MDRIRPISDLQSEAKSIIDAVRKTGEPVVITQRGRPAAMIVNYEEYEGLLATVEEMKEADWRERLAEAETDSRAGRGVDLAASRSAARGMAAKVRLLPRAERDLLQLPPPTQDRIIETLEMLQELPYMGPPMVGPFQAYRALLACRNQYRIIYKVVSSTRIDVAYIRHCRRRTISRVPRSAD